MEAPPSTARLSPPSTAPPPRPATFGLSRPAPDRRPPLRRWARRRLRLRRLAVVAIAVALTGSGFRLAYAAGRRSVDQRHWASVTVPLAARDLQPGDVVEAGDVRAVALPEALALLDPLPDAAGLTVIAPVYAGEVLHEARFSAHRLGLRQGEVAVALEAPVAALALREGDVVELVGVAADGVQGASARAIGSGRIVAADERSVTVALASSDALALLEHRAVGTVEVLLTPHRP